MDNMEVIAALQWAAREAGQRYGEFVARMTPIERDHALRAYARHKKEERARLEARRLAAKRAASRMEDEPRARHELPPTKEKAAVGRHYSFNVAAARSLYDDGYNDCQIAKELDMSVGAIRNWRKKAGLPPRAKRGTPKTDKETAQVLYDRGLDDAQIATELGVSAGAIQRWRSRQGLPPQGKQKRSFNVAAARSLYDDGYNDCQIAKELEVSADAIRNWRKKAGLPANAKRGRQLS